ncbi:hypothetical protein HN832_00735 [archaeon]|jgi:hypothetical protein|nr:hypothetical protein [archaeon]MBT4373852.1 hypothetical protein [archaeon]MBT4532374.1 hypothetical protein [archaeon]MBT7001755.1 hypothetical protein [archaeon]MBT7281920.1 hypothetical protein [archaeon]
MLLKSKKIKLELFRDNLLKDCRGEKILSIYWFFVLGVVGLGVVWGVLAFYGADSDVRILEANVLSEKLLRCVSENENILDESFDVFVECDLDKNIFEEEEIFYFRISFLNEDEEKLREDILGGVYSFEETCELTGKVEAKEYPKCVERGRVLSLDSQRVYVKVLAASNQRGEIFK